MTKNDLKFILKFIFLLAGIYIVMVIFVPRSTATNAFVEHFASVKTAVMGDGLFYIFTFAVLGLLYYFLMYRPRKLAKKNKEVSAIRKVTFAVVVVYAVLLIVLPLLTLPVASAAWIVTVVDHFILVKEIIISDFILLVISAGLLFGLYSFLVYKPKIK